MKALFIWHSDPGHGWLQVPLVTVHKFGCSISNYSYRDDKWAYLEEDTDAGKFLECLGFEPGFPELEMIPEKIHYEDCFIRRLATFNGTVSRDLTNDPGLANILAHPNDRS